MSGNELPLSGRHALVTGAGSGIGLAIAHELAGQGATLTLLGRRPAPLEAACAGLPGIGHGFVAADVCDAAAVAAAFAEAAARRGAVAILVNNAGAAQSAPLEKTTAALWAAMLAVNLSGAFHCLQAALPGMKAAGWGRVVNVASTAGLAGHPYVAAYCAAKHGLVGLTRAAAAELAKTGITVNAVCPGYTESELLDATVANIVARTGRSAEAARGILAATNPQGRLVTPAEVANAVGWLCLPAAAAVTGQAIVVAGGEIQAG